MSFNPISSVIGAVANGAATLYSNHVNRGLARDQQNYMTGMSNTSHQREVEDLIKAGLNPVLSAGGNGASTPSPSVPSMAPPQIDMPSIISMYTTEKQLEQNQQRIDLEKMATTASIAKTMSDTDLNKMKKILYQKGMIKAELEGEASDVLKNMINFLKSNWKQNNPPKILP